MHTHRNPDDTHAARALGYALTVTFTTGIATTLVPPAQTVIITTAAVLVVLYLAVRVIAWRVRERRLDRTDVVAAAAARAAYDARQHAKPTGMAWSDRGAA